MASDWRVRAHAKLVRARWIVWVGAVAAGMLGAQDGRVTDMERRRQQYPQLYDIAELAQGAPPELRAWALLRIAASPALTDRAWKEELIRNAAEAARLAQTASPVWYVLLPNGISGPLATRVRRALVLNRGLDRLTLGATAVRQMLELDPRQAREIFSAIPPPHPDALACADELVPDTSAYFTAAESIARRAFTREEIERREPAAFVRTVIVSTTSPAQTPALLKLVSRLELPPADRTSTLLALAAALDGYPRDSRSWTVRLNEATAEFSRLLQSSADTDRPMVLRAWRSYLLRGFSPGQCDNPADSASPYFEWRRNAVEGFDRAAGWAGLPSIAAISEEEKKQITVDPAVKYKPPESSGRLQQLTRMWSELAFGGGKDGLTDEQKRLGNWPEKFTAYLKAIDDLSANDVADGDELLRTKCSLFSAAAAVAPPGPMREQALGRFLITLSTTNPVPETVPEWYSLVMNWLDLGSSFGIRKESSLKQLAESTHALMRLIGRTELAASGK